MAQNDFDYAGKTPENSQQKCPVVFILDVSGSMVGAPINELNKGLQAFKSAIQNDSTAAARLDVAVVSFDSETRVEHDFGLINNDYQMPVLESRGSTAMVDAVRMGLQLIDGRKKWYKSSGQTYYRPYVILITDGYPDPNQDIEGLAAEIKKGTTNKAYNFWPIAVEGADTSVLDKWRNIHTPGRK